MANGRQESIHPRVYYPNGGVKKNTAKPRSKVRLQRQLAGITKHLETHPRDGMSVARVATIKQILGA